MYQVRGYNAIGINAVERFESFEPVGADFVQKNDIGIFWCNELDEPIFRFVE